MICQYIISTYLKFPLEEKEKKVPGKMEICQYFHFWTDEVTFILSLTRPVKNFNVIKLITKLK